MSRLSKAEAKAHARACEILTKPILTIEEREFVIQNWQESANHVNSTAGAFFTPLDLAQHLALEVGPGRVIDLCAGIGTLSRAVLDLNRYGQQNSIVCIELNPAYVEVGRKIVPEAEWICADVMDAPHLGLGRFSNAISNPPFGRIDRDRTKRAPRYTGSDFEFIVVDVAASVAGYGTFILPQMSAGFNYSGRAQGYERQTSGKSHDFQRATGLHFEAGCGVDCNVFRKQWRGVAPVVEIVCINFEADFNSASPPPLDTDVPFECYEGVFS